MIVMLYNDEHHQRSTLLVVLEPDNLERMKKADPISLMPQEFGGILHEVNYPSRLRVLIGYEADAGELYQMMQNRASPLDILSYIERGYKFTATDGKFVPPVAHREGGDA